MRKEKPLNKDSILKAFKCIDKNGDGFITYDELFTLLTKVCSLSQNNSHAFLKSLVLSNGNAVLGRKPHLHVFSIKGF